MNSTANINIEYREGIELHDIITVLGKKYVVVSISYEMIELEPIDDYIMKNSLIIYNNRYQSIRELVDYKVKNFVDDRDKGLTAGWNDMIAIP